MYFVLVLILCILLLTIHLYRTQYNGYWKKRNVAEHGNVIIDFLRSGQSLAEVYKNIYDSHPSHNYVGHFAGVKPSLLIKDLRDVQAVFATDFESFYSRGILVNENDILGDNILSIDHYERWRLLRQKVSPVFTSAKLKSMCYIIERSAADFVNMMKENRDMRLKPFNALYTYTTGSIGASVFGIDTHMESSMDSPFIEMSWNTLSPSFSSVVKAVIGFTFPSLFKLLKFKIFGIYEDFFVGAVKSVLKHRRNQAVAKHDFIDLCIELQQSGTMKDPITGYEVEPTDEVMAAQAFFFFLAGAETSANTMHFALIELANNPDVLHKLHDEIDNAFGDFGEKKTFEVIEKMQYLDMVLNESLRKYPPIGIIQRMCTKDTILPAGNVKVKKGEIVIVPAYAIHRDSKYYPDPDEFDPERFASHNISKIPKFANLSFGEGKRACLGARYARLQVKAGLMFLLRSFTLNPQHYEPKKFEKSFFALRDSTGKYELVDRNL